MMILAIWYYSSLAFTSSRSFAAPNYGIPYRCSILCPQRLNSEQQPRPFVQLPTYLGGVCAWTASLYFDSVHKPLQAFSTKQFA
jgi:hypothetical protein